MAKTKKKLPPRNTLKIKVVDADTGATLKDLPVWWKGGKGHRSINKETDIATFHDVDAGKIEVSTGHDTRHPALTETIDMPGEGIKEHEMRVPGATITFYLVHVRYPADVKHVGTLEIRKCTARARALWPGRHVFAPTGERKPGDPSFDAFCARVQTIHQTTAPARAALLKPDTETRLLTDVPCMNFDLNNKVDIAHETVLRIAVRATPKVSSKTEVRDGTFWMSDEDAYGKYPRLAFWGTQARIHCGREYRQSHSTSNLSNGHLIRDRDGEWTELTGTHGCIRVSWLWMKEIFATLSPIRNIDFDYEEAAGKTILADGYEPATEGHRTIAPRAALTEPDAVGFLYAEQIADCQAKATTIRYTLGETTHDESVCKSVEWANQAFVDRAHRSPPAAS